MELFEKTAEKKMTNCIRCGRCIKACPLNLMPTELEKAYYRKDSITLKKLRVGLCMNCGCCTYVCPAGRQLAQEIVSRLKECFPEQYADAYLDRTATVLGVREGRRIRGLYTLTSEDYIARRDFPDEIARNCYNLDSHETKTERLLIAQGKKKAGSNERILYAPGESHGIPYRSLLPEKLYNVIVAGRSISAERPVMGSIRVMGTCFSTGEAAGAAAAQAVREGGYNFHLLNTDTLRATLKRYGANIH